MVTENPIAQEERVAERLAPGGNRLNLPDIITLVWTLTVLALLILRPVPHRAGLTIAHLGIAVWVLVQPALRDTRLGWLSHWYPIGLSAFFFEEIQSLVHALHSGWYDSYIFNTELLLLGVHPTVWFERYISWQLTEVMSFFYFSYWPLIPVVALLIWFKSRPEFQDLVFKLSVAYVICYVVFILFPVEGPHHTLGSLQTVSEMPGGPFTWIVNKVEQHGRIHGGAFPSAHVAGSFIALFAAMRFSRFAGAVTSIIVAGMCVATVYGRYHYATDIAGGLAVALLAEGVGRQIANWKERDGPIQQ